MRDADLQTILERIRRLLKHVGAAANDVDIAASESEIDLGTLRQAHAITTWRYDRW